MVALAGLMVMWSRAAEMYSYAPRSSYALGPAPVFGVDGSSTRGRPSTSVADWPLTPEFAESIAGEPPRRCKSPPVRFTHLGSACFPCDSCPVADWNADSEL